MSRILKIILIFSVLFSSLSGITQAAEEKLTWQDCIKEASINHPDLIAAQEEITQSQASKAITASALYPQITADLNAATAKTSTEASGTMVSKTADSYSYGLSGTQLIFDGLQTINDVRAAEQTVQANVQNFRYTSATVRLRLRTAFINLLTAQELIRVTEQIVKIRKEDLELITLRYLSGLEHRGAVLTAEANMAEALFQLAQAKRDIELAQRQLTKEMGRKEFKPMVVGVDFNVRDTAKIKPDFESLALKNPSFLQLSAQKRAAEFSLKSTYGTFYPKLTGAAGANKGGSHWAPKGDEWNLSLALSLPLFEGGLRLAQVSQAKAFLRQITENERSTRDGLVVALEQNWVSLQDAVDTVSVQNKQLIAAQERSKIAEAEFATGFISFDNWTIIEDNLVTAKIQYLNAQSNALLAEANWIQAKGETLEYAQ